MKCHKKRVHSQSANSYVGLESLMYGFGVGNKVFKSLLVCFIVQIFVALSATLNGRIKSLSTLTKSMLAFEMSENNMSHFWADALKALMDSPQPLSLCQTLPCFRQGLSVSWGPRMGTELQPILHKHKMRREINLECHKPLKFIHTGKCNLR